MEPKTYSYISTCPVWDELITDFLKTEVGQNLKKTVADDRYNGTVYPEAKNLFKAFKLSPYDKTKVVILGQDPYHDGSADGLAFSCQSTKRPPSLRNVFAEIMRTEYGMGLDDGYVFKSNDLMPWAEQGVLLTNTSLTVKSGAANSHSKLGWKLLIESVMRKLNEKQTPTVFMLWGSEAKELGTIIKNPMHLKLESPHPVAQNFNPIHKFVGNDHFRTCREWFVKQKPQILGINWRTLD